MADSGSWIWFEDEVRGPYPAWEVQLIASKCRHFLIFDRQGRWVRYGDWDRHSAAGDRPERPSALTRLGLALSRTLFRRILQVHH